MAISDMVDGKDKAQYSPGYKDTVFTVWYKGGKPNPTYLYGMIPEDEFSRKPSRSMLNIWIKEEFEERAIPIDDAVRVAINERLMHEKIEMLERHAEIGSEMQNMALDYLRTHKDDLTPISAVRMLVEGVKVEKGSRGIPDVLRKMMDMSDEDLLKETQNLLLKAPITELEAIDLPDYEEVSKVIE